MSAARERVEAPRREDARDWYLARFEDFEKRLNGETARGVHALRRAAIERFAAIGLPTGRDGGCR